MTPPPFTPGEGPDFHSETSETLASPDAAAAQSGSNETELHQLFADLFVELHQRAKWSMAKEGPAHTLQATALIGEAFVRLKKSGQCEWDSNEHFLLSAARVMRTILLDHYRKKTAIKRDLNRVEMDMDDIARHFEVRGVDLEKLEIALQRLEVEQPIMARAIQLRFFAGVEVDEIATILNIQRRTLERRMQAVRAWLRTQI
ncbi:MAG: sigma-70 family RNA polymerase sigma factor [Planctomycetes bacterium]|nr:sigma-70 family RNA polymerase sigma factor [Planctomycetota bacterium]